MRSAKIGWLVSYPKSGSTWLRAMLQSLMSGGAPVDINALSMHARVASRAELDELLGIESSELTAEELTDVQPAFHAALAADCPAPLLLRKVHDRFWRTNAGDAGFPGACSRGAVYVVRDPRDVAVSYAHHRGRDVDSVIDFMANQSACLAGADGAIKEQLPQPLGSWTEHVASWLDEREMRVLTVRYEDLAREPARQLAAVTAHLGIAGDARCIESAVAASRFEVLRAQERAHGFMESRVKSSMPFFRQGRAGGWRTALTSAQIDRIVRTQRTSMARLGYI